MRFRYTRWDGSQQVLALDADDLIEAMSDDLIRDGDPLRALRDLLRKGAQNREGQRIRGLDELREQLRQMRQRQLDRYDLSSIVKDLQQKLQEVLQAEREGIQHRLDEGQQKVQQARQPRQSPRQPGDSSQQGAQPPQPSGSDVADEAGEDGLAPEERTAQMERLQQMLERMAQQKRQQLDQLPEDLGGRIKGLMNYDFMDQGAREKFQELLQMLQQQVLQSQFQGLQQALQGMTPESLKQAQQMVRDLNQMLRERAEGGRPDFDGFMEKWGELFPGANNLDDIVDQLQQRREQMQALMDSMTKEQRRQFEDMMRQVLRDQSLQSDLAELSELLDEISPVPPGRQRRRFRGDESLSLQDAMQLMEELQEMEDLERQIRNADDPGDLEDVDAEELRRLLGDEAAADFERLREIAKLLEEAGFLEQKGRRWELTPAAVRKIGEKALRDVFAQLKQDRVGKHETGFRGLGGDRGDETKAYEFGDQFLLDLKGTLHNAVVREGPGTPVRLQPQDFEVYRTELLTQWATVLMLDMSRSMMLRDCWTAAKKVALALNSLIRGQFPRDKLYIVGFSLYAKQLEPESLPHLMCGAWNYGTNMQHGFMLARQLLARQKGGNRQIIMITDGEPTAHLEGALADFQYPTSPRTWQETLKEVQRCTREQVRINTFMLEDSVGLMRFVEHMTRINRGRAFYATPDALGEYILVDYVHNKRKRVV
ncbi:MAG: VWA domain-containing protein [Chloroflexi bacterium]|nr:VWA domain-containing protein [Chloroflexota bacterium]